MFLERKTSILFGFFAALRYGDVVVVVSGGLYVEEIGSSSCSDNFRVDLFRSFVEIFVPFDFKIVHASVFVLAIEFKVRNKMGFYQISNER